MSFWSLGIAFAKVRKWEDGKLYENFWAVPG